MTAADAQVGARLGASLPFPPGPIIASWWELLAPQQPLQFWVGHLFLHDLEALVVREQTLPLDPLAQVLLHALDLETQTPVGTGLAFSRLQQRLRLDSQLLQSWLLQLERSGLVQHAGAGGWELTTTGKQSLANGVHIQLVRERRAFTFLDPRPLANPAAAQPFLVTANLSWATPWPEAVSWPVDPALLQEYCRQPLAWKETWGFPTDIRAVLHSPAEAVQQSEEWSSTLVDHPAHLTVAVCECGGATPAWRAFALHTEDWQLEATDPALTLRPDMLPLLGLSAQPNPAALRASWRQWSESQGWSVTNAEVCTLEASGASLQVSVPAELSEELATILQEETWLLVGEGPLRRALRVKKKE